MIRICKVESLQKPTSIAAVVITGRAEVINLLAEAEGTSLKLDSRLQVDVGKESRQAIGERPDREGSKMGSGLQNSLRSEWAMVQFLELVRQTVQSRGLCNMQDQICARHKKWPRPDGGNALRTMLPCRGVRTVGRLLVILAAYLRQRRCIGKRCSWSNGRLHRQLPEYFCCGNIPEALSGLIR